MNTDYILPSASWIPPYGPALTSQSRLYFPGAGGTIYFRDQVDAATGTSGQLAFYGLANYQANPQAYNAGVIINTPLTTDPSGNIYFGFQVTGSTPLGLTSGIARISASGQGTWIPVTTASADANMTKVPHNSAPALSADHQVLYVAVSNGAVRISRSPSTARPLRRWRACGSSIRNPDWMRCCRTMDTASPTVGTDGDVYFGVLENPFGSNHRRGWLLHFNGNLSQSKTPGAFGWDTTASLVPAHDGPLLPGHVGVSPDDEIQPLPRPGRRWAEQDRHPRPQCDADRSRDASHGDEGSADDARADTGVRAAASRNGASIPPPWIRSPNPSSRTTRTGNSIGGI